MHKCTGCYRSQLLYFLPIVFGSCCVSHLSTFERSLCYTLKNAVGNMVVTSTGDWQTRIPFISFRIQSDKSPPPRYWRKCAETASALATGQAIHISVPKADIDSAAKFIGAGVPRYLITSGLQFVVIPYCWSPCNPSTHTQLSSSQAACSPHGGEVSPQESDKNNCS